MLFFTLWKGYCPYKFIDVNSAKAPAPADEGSVRLEAENAVWIGRNGTASSTVRTPKLIINQFLVLTLTLFELQIILSSIYGVEIDN